MLPSRWHCVITQLTYPMLSQLACAPGSSLAQYLRQKTPCMCACVCVCKHNGTTHKHFYYHSPHTEATTSCPRRWRRALWRSQTFGTVTFLGLSVRGAHLGPWPEGSAPQTGLIRWEHFCSLSPALFTLTAFNLHTWSDGLIAFHRGGNRWREALWLDPSLTASEC